MHCYLPLASLVYFVICDVECSYSTLKRNRIALVLWPGSGHISRYKLLLLWLTYKIQEVNFYIKKTLVYGLGFIVGFYNYFIAYLFVWSFRPRQIKIIWVATLIRETSAIHHATAVNCVFLSRFNILQKIMLFVPPF